MANRIALRGRTIRVVRLQLLGYRGEFLVGRCGSSLVRVSGRLCVGTDGGSDSDL